MIDYLELQNHKLDNFKPSFQHYTWFVKLEILAPYMPMVWIGGKIGGLSRHDVYQIRIQYIFIKKDSAIFYLEYGI